MQTRVLAGLRAARAQEQSDATRAKSSAEFSSFLTSSTSLACFIVQHRAPRTRSCSSASINDASHLPISLAFLVAPHHILSMTSSLDHDFKARLEQIGVRPLHLSADFPSLANLLSSPQLSLADRRLAAGYAPTTPSLISPSKDVPALPTDLLHVILFHLITFDWQGVLSLPSRLYLKQASLVSKTWANAAQPLLFETITVAHATVATSLAEDLYETGKAHHVRSLWFPIGPRREGLVDHTNPTERKWKVEEAVRELILLPRLKSLRFDFPLPPFDLARFASQPNSFNNLKELKFVIDNYSSSITTVHFFLSLTQNLETLTLFSREQLVTPQSRALPLDLPELKTFNLTLDSDPNPEQSTSFNFLSSTTLSQITSLSLHYPQSALQDTSIIDSTTLSTLLSLGPSSSLTHLTIEIFRTTSLPTLLANSPSVTHLTILDCPPGHDFLTTLPSSIKVVSFDQRIVYVETVLEPLAKHLKTPKKKESVEGEEEGDDDEEFEKLNGLEEVRIDTRQWWRSSDKDQEVIEKLCEEIGVQLERSQRC